MHVFRMSDERWYTKVEAGVEGLTRVEWAPDGRHIVCFSDWAVRTHLTSPCRELKRMLAASRYHLVARQWRCDVHPISITS